MAAPKGIALDQPMEVLLLGEARHRQEIAEGQPKLAAGLVTLTAPVVCRGEVVVIHSVVAAEDGLGSHSQLLQVGRLRFTTHQASLDQIQQSPLEGLCPGPAGGIMAVALGAHHHRQASLGRHQQGSQTLRKAVTTEHQHLGFEAIDPGQQLLGPGRAASEGVDEGVQLKRSLIPIGGQHGEGITGTALQHRNLVPGFCHGRPAGHVVGHQIHDHSQNAQSTHRLSSRVKARSCQTAR